VGEAVIVIHKYPCLPNVYDWVVQMHQGSEILSLGWQYTSFVYWVKLDSTKPQVPRRLKLFMTGQPFEDTPDAKYIGTCSTPAGFPNEFTAPFVLHLFDLGECA
jgi:hypothetical protein